jgi:hypothetical protein
MTKSAKAPLGTRILRDTRAWEALTADQVIAEGDKANRTASSRAAWIVTGLPDRRARITETTIDLHGRRLTLRVYRPKRAASRLPLILSFHGGGFIGIPAPRTTGSTAVCPPTARRSSSRLSTTSPHATRCRSPSRTATTRSSGSSATPRAGASTRRPLRSSARARAA